MTEPEEIIENKLVTRLHDAVPTIDVLGALTPAFDGVAKRSPDTYISVFADVASQDLDWEGPGAPFTYSVRVAVHVANADDRSCRLFRDTCRAVRGALAALAGDKCNGLDGDGFFCSSFILDSTATSQDAAAETGGMAKIYNATVTGRHIPTTQEES